MAYWIVRTMHDAAPLVPHLVVDLVIPLVAVEDPLIAIPFSPPLFLTVLWVNQVSWYRGS